MNDFIERAEELLLQHPEWLSEEDKRSFRTVFDMLGRLQSLYAKAQIRLDNIEELFGLLEMARLVRGLPGYSDAELNVFRIALLRTVVRTLELAIRFRRDRNTIQPANAYSELAYQISRRASEVAVITFNYDIALDHALFSHGVPVSYGKEENGVPLLKLHGSINWGYCTTCASIQTSPWELLGVEMDEKTGTVAFPVGSQMIDSGFNSPCGHRIQGYPLIVPPTWQKNYEANEAIRQVWIRAAHELKDAEHVLVIGYSLPDSDLFFRYLYAVGAFGPARIKTFSILDPSNSVHARFQQFLAEPVRRRGLVFTGMFEDVTYIQMFLERADRF